jgi:hypothetical protein
METYFSELDSEVTSRGILSKTVSSDFSIATLVVKPEA